MSKTWRETSSACIHASIADSTGPGQCSMRRSRNIDALLALAPARQRSMRSFANLLAEAGQRIVSAAVAGCHNDGRLLCCCSGPSGAAR